jgi:hypothetical protein
VSVSIPITNLVSFLSIYFMHCQNSSITLYKRELGGVRLAAHVLERVEEGIRTYES